MEAKYKKERLYYFVNVNIYVYKIIDFSHPPDVTFYIRLILYTYVEDREEAFV